MKERSTRASRVRRAGISGLLLGGLPALASGSCADLVGANFDIADTGTGGGGDGGTDAGGDAGGSCLGPASRTYGTEFHAFPRAVAHHGCDEVAIVGELWTDPRKPDSARRPFVAWATPQESPTALGISLKPVPDGAFQGVVFGGAWNAAYDGEGSLYFGGLFLGVLELPGLDPIPSGAGGGPGGAADGFLAKLGPERTVEWMLRVDADKVAGINAIALDPQRERIFSAGGFTSKQASLFLHKGPPGSPIEEQVVKPLETSLATGVEEQTDVFVVVQEKSGGEVVNVAHLMEPAADGARRKEGPLALAVSQKAIVVAGFYESRFPFNVPNAESEPYPGPGNWFGFVAALDRESAADFGKLKWARGIGAVDTDATLLGGYLTFASNVAFLDESIVVVGGFIGSLKPLGAECESLVAPVSGQVSADVFVARLDLEGRCLWVRAFGGRGRDIAEGLAVHPETREIFVHGTQGIGDSVAYAGPERRELPSNPERDQGFVLRLRADGELLGYRGYDRGGAPVKEDPAFILRHTAALHTTGAKEGLLLLGYPSRPVDGGLANGVLEVFDADIQLPSAP